MFVSSAEGRHQWMPNPCIIVLLILFLFSTVNAANLSCSVKASCSGGETDVLHMSNLTNAHAELPNQTNFNYSICCIDLDADTTLGNSSGTEFLHLSDVTNAQVEKVNETNFNYSAYISADNSNYNVSCGYGTNSCTGFDTCLASISNDTNAHIGNCSAFNITVCCSLNRLNTLPVAENVTLNSTYGTNYTTENLTLYWDVYDLDNDSIYNITNWYLNGTSILELNMPFEANGGNESTLIKDYSNNSRDSSFNNASWTSTGGYDGWGAYDFGPGSYEYAEIPSFNTDPITVSIWFKVQDHTIPRYIVDKDAEYELSLNTGTPGCGANTLCWWVQTTSGALSASVSNIAIMDNQWYHIVGTFDNNTGATLYINGAWAANDNSYPGSSILPLSAPICLGTNSQVVGCNSNPSPFPMTLDQLQIYNRELSPEQIAALSNSRTDLIVSQETAANDVWLGCITPNDGTGDGNESCSNNLTVIAPYSYEISSCRNITQNGTYNVTTNLVGNLSNGACIYVNASDVSINCSSHTVTGNNPGTTYGIWLDNVDNVTMMNCIVSNYSRGAYSLNSTNIVLDPSSFCDSTIGILVNQSNNALIDDSIACRNTQYGIYLLDSNASINRSRTYNNSMDLRVENTLAVPMTTSITNLLFDYPGGSYYNFTNLSLSETATSSGFQMNWSLPPAPWAPEYTSFRGKTLNISATSGTPQLDSVIWHWTDIEAAAYDESRFELLKYNSSGWTNTYATLNTTANTLTLTNLNPQSVYSIVETDYLPMAENVTLNSTYGTNYTTENLTLYWDVYDPDSSAIYNVTNWYLNGSPIMELNMPFEANGGNEGTWTKDYSNNSRNGTVNTAGWASSGGHDGWGYYSFGVAGASSIQVPTFHTDPISVSMWIYANDVVTTRQTIIQRPGEWRLVLNPAIPPSGCNPLDLCWIVTTPTGDVGVGIPSGGLASKWSHVVGTFNSSSIDLYVDSAHSPGGPPGAPMVISPSPDPICIGTAASGGGCPIGPNFFYGDIDQVQVYNRKLGQAQITRLYNKSTDIIVSQETAVNDVWLGCITPNDGNKDGNESCSNNLTILSVPIPNCPVINSSQTYQMNNSFTGAPNSASPFSGNACVKITASNVVFDCNGYSIANNGTTDTYGILLNGSLTNVTVKNCPSISNYSLGVYTYDSNETLVQNVTVYSSNDTGFYLEIGTNNDLTGNKVYGSVIEGFLIKDCDHCSISDNQVFDTPIGYKTYGGGNNTFSNNTATNASLYGFNLGSTVGRDNPALENNLTANKVYGVGVGFYLENADYCNLNSNYAYNVSNESFYLDIPSQHNSLVDNYAYNDWVGYFSYFSYFHTFTGNTANLSNYSGFYLYRSGNNNLSDNLAYDSGTAFEVFGGGNHTLTNNTAIDPAYEGFVIGSVGSGGATSNSTFIDNTAYGSAYDGFYIQNSYNCTFTGSSAYDNARYGIFIKDPDNMTFTDTHVYNSSTRDVYIVNGANMSVTMNNLTIDNPSGNFQNFTALDITDIVEANTEYSLTWTVNPASPPASYTSFRQKYVNITEELGSVSIDDIRWTWTDAELSGYTESLLEVWEYSAGWSRPVQTLSEAGNYIEITGLQPGSDYAILESSTAGNCPVVSSSFTMNSSYTGAPNLATPLDGLACVKIIASDLVFDCAGYSITNDGTPDKTHGILVNGSLTNVTIKNCPDVEGYTYAFHMFNSTDITVTNSTSRYSNDTGFYLNGCDDCTIYDNTAANDQWVGFYAPSSTARNVLISFNDNLTNNTAYGTDTGFAFGGAGHAFTDNKAYSNNYVGFYLSFADNITFSGDTAYSNGQYGIYLSNSDNNTLANIHLYDNPTRDFYVRSTGTSRTISASNLTIDNPSGNLQDYTVLDIDDTIEAGTAYALRWASQPAPFPFGYTTFADKFVNITAETGTVSVDTIVWKWLDSELTLYNESLFELWKYDSINWTNTNATLNAPANTLTLTNMNPASTYGILLQGVPVTDIVLFGANITNVTMLPRFNNTGPANQSTQAGNLTELNLSATQLSERWASFYGDVNGSIVLTGVTGANYVYSWTWDASDGGVICVSTNSSLSQFSASGAQGSDIDNAWVFSPSATDSGANTFNLTNCTFDIGIATVYNASYADTGPPGGFKTCIIKSESPPTKDQMVFCSPIINAGTAWDGSAADYELIIPTPSAPGSTETYYFYANLQ